MRERPIVGGEGKGIGGDRASYGGEYDSRKSLLKAGRFLKRRKHPRKSEEAPRAS